LPPSAVGSAYSQPPSREVDLDPGLLIAAAQTEYKLKVRWYTRRDEDNCFARWLLIPAKSPFSAVES
jgi:hypothetical protein